MRVTNANPRPRMVVGPNAPRYSIDVSRVQDTIFTDRLTVRGVQRSLYLGFQNGVGQKFATERGPDTITLQFDTVTSDTARGERRPTIGLAYAGRWIAPNGTVIAEFRGIAGGRDPDAIGKRSVEDAMAMMLEQCVGYLADAQARMKAAQPAPAPVDTGPRLPPAAPPTAAPPDLRLPPNKPPGT